MYCNFAQLLTQGRLCRWSQNEKWRVWETPFQSRGRAVTSHTCGLPFPAASSYFSSIDGRETRTALTLSAVPIHLFILWGIRQEGALVPPLKCRIYLPAAECGGWCCIERIPLHWPIALMGGCWITCLWNKPSVPSELPGFLPSSNSMDCWWVWCKFLLREQLELCTGKGNQLNRLSNQKAVSVPQAFFKFIFFFLLWS